ncbi:unnamed protein product, partial [marine sediment metagenome]
MELSSTKTGQVSVTREKRIAHIDKNLDRNIFLSSQAKYKSYVFEVPILLDDGSEGVRYIVVGKANPYEGQDDQKNFDTAKFDTSSGAGV